jgi:hypothetical protein
MAIKDFINTWQYKHPTPYDLINTFEKHGTGDVEWFIDEWFFQQGWPDLGIENVQINGDTLSMEIVKKGRLPVPVELDLYYEGDEQEILRWNPDIWKDKDKLIITRELPYPLVRMILNQDNFPDKVRSDNHFGVKSFWLHLL